MSTTTPRWRTERWVAETLGVGLPTLRNSRSTGKGIPFYRFGRSVRYREDEVLAWCEAHRAPLREGAR